MLKRKSCGAEHSESRSPPLTVFKRVKSTPDATPGPSLGSALSAVPQIPSPLSSPGEFTPFSVPSEASVVSASDSSYSSVKRHPKYYLEDGNVVFLVSAYAFLH